MNSTPIIQSEFYRFEGDFLFFNRDKIASLWNFSQDEFYRFSDLIKDYKWVTHLTLEMPTHGRPIALLATRRLIPGFIENKDIIAKIAPPCPEKFSVAIQREKLRDFLLPLQDAGIILPEPLMKLPPKGIAYRTGQDGVDFIETGHFISCTVRSPTPTA